MVPYTTYALNEIVWYHEGYYGIVTTAGTVTVATAIGPASLGKVGTSDTVTIDTSLFFGNTGNPIVKALKGPNSTVRTDITTGYSLYDAVMLDIEILGWKSVLSDTLLVIR